MENGLLAFYTVALYGNELFWKERKAQRIAGAADDDIRLYPAVIGKNHLLALKPCNLRFDEDGPALHTRQQVIARSESRTPQIKLGQRQSLGMQLLDVDSCTPVFAKK